MEMEIEWTKSVGSAELVPREALPGQTGSTNQHSKKEMHLNILTEEFRLNCAIALLDPVSRKSFAFQKSQSRILEHAIAERHCHRGAHT